MVGRWEAGQHNRGIEPIPEWLDADLGYIAVASVLGVTPMDVTRLPGHWVSAALIKLEAERLNNQRRGRS